uniref:GAF domain-containing sensor histidine kinase n=1 Tax=Algoriphagus sp. TaxID=1872435 RepID=UPI0025828ED3|nr:ATP-binding protein [Algoriphagus sp.]
MTQESLLNNPGLDQVSPLPQNEMERIMALSELDLDYLDLEKSFSDLTKLAAKVAGTPISLINLIDSFTQWSVSAYGIEIKQMPREESVCQYTLLEENAEGFEVKDLSQDERFKDKFYVAGEPNLKYYYGIPLLLDGNRALGALCVLSDEYKNLSAEKKEMLEIIAGEVVNRIKINYAVAGLKKKVQETTAVKNRVAHDIRGPIGGIIGLAEIIQMQGNQNKLEEVLDFIALIRKSGKSVLELADEILTHSIAEKDLVKRGPMDHEFTLLTLQSKLEDMFTPQAVTKNVSFEVKANPPQQGIPFPKNKILQILGNLISNSIKFTPAGGEVLVDLDMEITDQSNHLRFLVKDSGVGIAPEKILEIMEGGTASSQGTSGEKGFGFGLNLVHHLIKSLNGTMSVSSAQGQGAQFELIIPLDKS